VASDSPISALSVQRVKHLLRDIAEGPFVTVIFDGDDLRIYTAGLDAEKLTLIEKLVESLTVESASPNLKE